MYDIRGRKKIVIWGINESIWGAIQKTINPFAVEIVVFIDSDSYKQGLLFHRIPIIHPSEVELREIDYVLIAAYSSMQIIYDKLLMFGVPNNMIAPYLTNGLVNYNVGDISQMNWKETLYLYFEPDRMKDIVLEYIKLFLEYKSIKPFEIEKTHWSSEKHLISHACGGYVDGRPLMYSNSKEALEYTIQSGFQLMECDACKMPNGEWYLAHGCSDFNRSIEEKYSPLSLYGLLLALTHNPSLSCLFDVKYRDDNEFEDFILRLNDFVENSSNKQIKSRLIIEVYNEDTINIAKKYGYELFFTEYRNDKLESFMNTAILCEKYNIPIIGMRIQHFLTERKRIGIFTEKGIRIYTYSTDAPEMYSTVREYGAYGVFTNYLSKKNRKQ